MLIYDERVVCIKVFNNKNDNKKVPDREEKSKVDSEYRNNDELTDKNSYMKYELNNTFNDKDNKVTFNDKKFK
nr:hypothetical protein [Sedimentibacter sp.]